LLAGDAAAAPAAAALGTTKPAPPETAAAPAPVVAVLLGTVVSTDPGLSLDQPLDATAPRVELALVRGAHAEGLAVPAAAVAMTLDALVGSAPLTLLRLSEVPGVSPAPAYTALADRLQAQPLPFESVARNALTCRFDLCQFEFSAQVLKFGRDTWRRWRLPIGLAALCLLVAIVGENVQWLVLAHQRDALNGQMTELLLTAFPKTTVVLDAPTQMSHQLEQLRTAAGELSPDDFLSLAVGLAASLGPLPSSTLAALDYQQRALTVTFKPDVQVDDGLVRRLASNGLEGKYQQGKWIIRSSR
jgi:general secretion pathway protein L